MKFLKILAVIILILFPFGELLRFNIDNHLAWKPLDFVIFLTAFSWAIICRKKIKNYLKLKYLLFPLIGLTALVINLSWLRPNEALISFLYLVRWVMYASLLPVFLTFTKDFRKRIQMILFFDGLLMVLFGFIQYIFYNDLHNIYYLGWDPHMHRIFSTFLDPNFTGGFFVMYFVLVAGMLLEVIRKKSSVHQKRMLIFGLGSVLLFTLLAIFLTFSRAAILMLIASMVVFFVLAGKKKFIALVLLAVALFILAASPKFYDENMNLFRVNSSTARLSNYAVAIHILSDHPILGVGFNSYRYTKRLYNLPHDWVATPSHADAGVDNSWLFILVTTGIVGFVAYSFLWYLIFKKAYDIFKRNVFGLIVLSSAAGLFIHALFINSLFFGPIMVWMWIVIAQMKEG